jgi:ribosome-associated translation inhibitor RaiA
VEIIFHSHHASISSRMRRRAEIAAEYAASRMARAVDAIVRFEQDGPIRRVEIVLHAPRQRNIVARGEARFYGPALSVAIERLGAQVRKLRARKTSVRKRQTAKADKSGRWKRAGAKVALL